MNSLSEKYFALNPLKELKSLNGIDVPVVEQYDSEIDEIVTDKTRKEIIETVFAQNSLNKVKQKQSKQFSEGGVTNINGDAQEIWTPREFLYRQFNPDWKENPYIVSEEVGEEKLKNIAEKQQALELEIEELLVKHKAKTIFELPISEYDYIKEQRREIERIADFLTIPELDAFVFAHPELKKENYIDDYTYTKDDLIDKKLLFFELTSKSEGKWVYRYEYLAGNVNRKITHLERDEDYYLENISKEQWQIQKEELLKVRNPYARITQEGQNAITLYARSEFANDTAIFGITEIVGNLQFNGKTTINNAFKQYLQSDLIDPTTFQLVESYRDITRYYCDGETPPSDGTEDGERLKINILQNSKIEGQRLLDMFLDTELTREDKQRLEYEWNLRYNNEVECYWSKIPVALSLSKTFLNGVPFIPNPTQIQSVQYQMVTGSCLFAYGVGVGKTASAFMNISWALDNGLVKKPLIVTRVNIAPKFIGETQGKDETNAQGKTTGTFLQGLLPQYKVVDLGGLSYDEVRYNIKHFSEEEERLMTKMDELKEYIRNNVNKKTYNFEDKEVNGVIIANIDDFELEQIQRDYAFYLMPYQPQGDNPPEKKTKPMAIFEWWWGQQVKYISELPYRLGKVRDFGDGTIFFTTKTGIRRLGVYKPNIEEDINQNDSFFGQIFYELSQGEEIENMRGYGRENPFANKIESALFEAPEKPKIYLSELGIDFACFDESHDYKKVFTIAKGRLNPYKQDYTDGRKGRSNKKYATVGKGTPNDISIDAYKIVRYVQNLHTNSFGVIHLTATPVTNSPVEIYSMMALTNYPKLVKEGYSQIEDFFDLYMRINYDIRYTAQRKIVKDQVLLGFNNTPQMRRLLFSIIDYKSGQDANIKRPVKVIYPNLPKGIDTTLEPTPEQNDSFYNIKEFIKGEKTYQEICELDTVDINDYNEMDDEELIKAYEDLTGKAVDETPPLEDKTRKKFIDKLEQAQTKTQQFSTKEGKRIPKQARVSKALAMMRQVTISPYLFMCKKRSEIEPTATQYVESSPKLLYIINCIKNTLKYEKDNNLQPTGSVIYMTQGIEPKAMIPTEFEIQADGSRVPIAYEQFKWSETALAKIKKYLVDNSNLEENQISIVYGGTSKTAKVREMDKFLRGESLVMIGSKSISTGVDLQKNASQLFFADFDWSPTDAEQVEGRIHRQGNRMAYTRIVYPMLENSADPVIFQILQEKTMRIREIWDKEGRTSQLEINKEFDASDFKRKLITDPEEQAKYHIEVSVKDLEDNAIMYRNRLKTFQNLSEDYQTIQEERDILKKGLTILEHYAKEKIRKDGIKNLENKIDDAEWELEREKDTLEQEISDAKYELEYNSPSEQDQAELKKKITANEKKLGKLNVKDKIEKIKADAYDYVNDPEKRYEFEDYMGLTDEELVDKVQKVITDSNSWWQRNVGWRTQSEIDDFIKNNYPMAYFGRDESDNERIKQLAISKKEEIKAVRTKVRELQDFIDDSDDPFSNEVVKAESDLEELEEQLDDLKRELENIKDDDEGVNTDKAIRVASNPQFNNRGYSWRNAYRNYTKGKDRILALGLDPNDLTGALSEIRTKLQEFEDEIATIRDSEGELIAKFRLEAIANKKDLPTLSDRVIEYGEANGKYLTKFLSTFKIDETVKYGDNPDKDTSTKIIIGMTKPHQKTYKGEIIIELQGSKKKSVDIVVGDDTYEIVGGEYVSLGDYTVAEFEQLLVDNDLVGVFEFFDWAVKDGVEGGKPKLKEPPKKPIDKPVDKPVDEPIEPETSSIEDYELKIELYEDLIELAETDEEVEEYELKIELYQDLIELESE